MSTKNKLNFCNKILGNFRIKTKFKKTNMSCNQSNLKSEYEKVSEELAKQLDFQKNDSAEKI